MKRCQLVVTIAVILILSILNSDATAQRLGLRLGFAHTTSDLDEAFGNAVSLGGHWTQPILKPFSIDTSFGVLDLGQTGRDDLTFLIFRQSFTDVSMQVIYFTVAPQINIPIGESVELNFSAGLGLYVVNLQLEESIFQFDLTDNHLGVNTGVGIVRQMSTNWFVEGRFQLHKFWTSDESDDLFFLYSQGDENPLFYDATLGVMVRLF